MKAILAKEQENATNRGGEKEITEYCAVVGYDPIKGEIVTVAVLYGYMGRAPSSSVVYASFWLLTGGQHSGSGRAGGGGYHKFSAAADYAIRSAGIALDEYIDARGMGVVRDAMLAIAQAARPDLVALTVIGH